MKSLSLTVTLVLLSLLSACSQRPEPIEYGAESCHFCKMTIVDKQHAAEVVTSKGKVFKFDAIECMVRYQKADAKTKFAHQLVNDFEKPGELIPAAGAGYLISSAIPSPMGANLTAFENLAKAQSVQKSKGGEAMSWEELKRKLQ